MSYLAPQQKATVPGLHLVYSWEAIDRTSYPRRTPPFFENELPSLVLCEITEWFPTIIGCVLLFCSPSQGMFCRCLNRWNQLSLASNLLVSSFQPRSILFFTFAVSQRLLPFRHRKLNSATKG